MSESAKPISPSTMRTGDEFWTVHGIDVETKEFRLCRYRFKELRRHSGFVICSQLDLADSSDPVRVENLTLVPSDVFVEDVTGPLRGRFFATRGDAVRAMCEDFHREFLAVRGTFTRVHETFLAAREAAAKVGVRFGVPVPITEAEFEAKVDSWHGSNWDPATGFRTLHEFLGLTPEQYNACVEGRARWAEEPKGVANE